MNKCGKSPSGSRESPSICITYCLIICGIVSCNRGRVLNSEGNYAPSICVITESGEERIVLMSGNYDDAFILATNYLKKYAEENNIQHYEIVEDSNEYKNGLLFLEYLNKEHENEVEHFCINLDDEEELQSIKDWLANYDKKQNLDNPNNRTLMFGCLGNGITVFDSSRTDPETHDYPIVAHISNEGVVRYRTDKLTAEDRQSIENAANEQEHTFRASWDMLSDYQKLNEMLKPEYCNISQLVQINNDPLSVAEKVAKYEKSLIFGKEDFPVDDFKKENTKNNKHNSNNKGKKFSERDI